VELPQAIQPEIIGTRLFAIEQPKQP